ncbi:reverse transcriptase domain protein [Metarhizium robertsii]|uniref:Reverse transcriptase domain protein n=1 Tax=Metarhizium robertsii TaxID=568076 RepID=A0A014P0X0_9HYPO|nr:reverse transcriptase domain protein [Metarhizium robertsii]
MAATLDQATLDTGPRYHTGTESYTAWHGTKKVRPQIQHLVDKLDPVLRRAIRAILPVWKTTPVPIYHQESGIPPVSLLLEARRIRFAARLKSLDLAHPLAQRTAPTPIVRAVKQSCEVRGGGFKTRLERTALFLSDCPRPTVEGISPDELVVYSDGSQLPGGATGYGYVVHQNSVTVCEGSGRLGPAEVFDAEAVGALEGLGAAVKISDASDNPIVVCLDNLAAATCLRGTASDSSQSAFLKFQVIAAAHGSIHVHWIPGHTDIPGNEQAGSLAKAGCALPEPPDAKPTLAYIRRAWWQGHMPEKYKELKLSATTGCPKELSIPRPALHHLLAARSSHGDFADYHERFNHEGARISCSCGRRKTPDHLFYCRKVGPRHRMRLTPSPAAAINQAIGRDFDKFIQMAKASSFFARICPRH